MLKNKFLDYLLLEKNYSLLTIQCYKKDLEELEFFLLQTEDVSDIEKSTNRQLRNFIIHLSQKKISEKTINRKISSIRSFFKFLLKTSSLEVNPTLNIKNLKLRQQVLVPYSEDEIKILENTFIDIDQTLSEFEKTRNQLIFEIFYQTGIRRMELINLKISEIDFYECTIRIIGKRNKERQIPITDNLKEKLNQYISLKEDNHEYLFTNNKGEILKEKFVYNLINKYLSKVTSKQKKSPHMLRHTFASHLLHNGAELNSIKEILGHSSLAATQIYTHSNIDDLKKIFNQSHPYGHKKEENEN
ncbi:tyrosine-type recombinase/integrase [Apibacter adventoris]|uniref:tyrosine-type recombinase/integrase n=1 Tax=Apibacter adventoris TaxID=1679466 RepID=UPI000CF61466|nr:tyrosine-type recombinase/integrase [Apibacter adventoris]PQL93845.1 integrase [Apibacter adventoris]